MPVDEPIEVEPTELAGEDAAGTAQDEDGAGEAGGRRRRRRRRRRGRSEGREGAIHAGSAHEDDGAESDEDAEAEDDAGPEDAADEPESERRSQPVFGEGWAAAEATAPQPAAEFQGRPQQQGPTLTRHNPAPSAKWPWRTVP